MYRCRSGKDNLKFFKMAPKYPCIRAFSTCCWSQMAVQHPAYGGNVVCCGVSQVKSSRGGPVQMQFNTADLTLENADLVEQVGQWRYASFPIQCVRHAVLPCPMRHIPGCCAISCSFGPNDLEPVAPNNTLSCSPALAVPKEMQKLYRARDQ